ncbi:MAG: iron ABC transporter permease [Pseudomonadota bacterium]
MSAINPHTKLSSSGLIICLIAALVGAFLWSLAAGPVHIPLFTILKTLLGNVGHEHVEQLIIVEIRLPRVLLALLVGIGLGMSGAALQALVRNPLAEPGVLGISSSAALGAVLVFYTGSTDAFPFALPIGGLFGAMCTTAILFALAQRSLSTLNLILAGVAINAFTGAVTALALNLSPNPFAAYEIYFWLMGSFANRSIDHFWLTLPFATIGIMLLTVCAFRLDAFAFGEEVAGSLGVNTKRTQLFVIAGTALAVGSGVAVVGVIGFIGLVVPHLLRPIVGEKPSTLVPLSGIGGGLLTIVADNFCRVGVVSGELKIGVVTALLGAPFLLLIVLKKGKSLWSR